MTTKHSLGHLKALLLIGIGGFAGANLRYFFDLALPTALLPTLTVNVLGCAALGFVLYEGRYTGIVSERNKLVLATGFLSSFTTYSTFVLDAIETDPMLALGYVGTSYGLGFVAVLIGGAGARRAAAAGFVDAEIAEDESKQRSEVD